MIYLFFIKQQTIQDTEHFKCVGQVSSRKECNRIRKGIREACDAVCGGKYYGTDVYFRAMTKIDKYDALECLDGVTDFARFVLKGKRIPKWLDKVNSWVEDARDLTSEELAKRVEFAEKHNYSDWFIRYYQYELNFRKRVQRCFFNA